MRTKLLLLEAYICLLPATLFWLITMLVVIVPVWHHPLESSLQVLLLAPAAVGLYGAAGLLIAFLGHSLPRPQTIIQAGIGLLTALFLGLGVSFP